MSKVPTSITGRRAPVIGLLLHLGFTGSLKSKLDMLRPILQDLLTAARQGQPPAGDVVMDNSDIVMGVADAGAADGVEDAVGTMGEPATEGIQT